MFEEIEEHIWTCYHIRADDNADSFKKRISTYLESTIEVINEFEGRGLLRRINANETPEGVFKTTQQVFLVSF